jgi:hypothetical protein
VSALHSLGGHELAAKAVYRARKAWNEILGLYGSNGPKFSHHLRRFMDEMQSTRSFEASLMVKAIHLHVQELNKAKKSALQVWE